MIVRVIDVHVNPEAVSEFEAITLENQRGSLAEAGILRFDVLSDVDRPGEYVLYEVYENEEAIDAHKTTEHYKKWNEVVAPMMAGERKRRTFKALGAFPK